MKFFINKIFLRLFIWFIFLNQAYPDPFKNLNTDFLEDSKFVLRLVFGGEIERKITFDLNQKKELLCAINLLKQRDIRLDIFVQGQEGNLRFGVSRYLEDYQQHIQEIKNVVSNHVFKNFNGDEEDIKIAILKGLSR